LKTSGNPSNIVDVPLGVTGRFEGGDSDDVLVSNRALEEEQMVETNV